MAQEKLLPKSTAAEVGACMEPYTGLAFSLAGGHNKEMQMGVTHSAGFWFSDSFMALWDRSWTARVNV